MISNPTEIKAALHLLLLRERETAAVFAQAADELNEPELKKLFGELEQCARYNHGRLYDCGADAKNSRQQWLYAALANELLNQNLYNQLMARITDLPTRQMLQQLRDSKMRSIVLLQEELKQQKTK